MNTSLFRFALLALFSAFSAFAVETAPAPSPATETKPAAQAPAVDPAKRIENSVIHIFVTARNPDIMKPWSKASPTEKSGSGVVIAGKRILTNAHVVLYSSQVQVQGDQSGDKFNASVEFIDPYIDLAVLKVDDESFFDKRPAVERSSELPQLKDSVMAYGYPTGGTNLSITKGIVSRVEYAGYNSPVSGIRIQIDAAINPGNSGGPAIAGDKMIGLAFSNLGGAQNIGYIIPCEEIEMFLKDIEDGKVDGKPAFYDLCQTNENTALRTYLKFPAGAEGLIVNQLENSDPAYPLKAWDLITKVGPTKIDNQGMVRLPNGQPIRFLYEVPHVAKNGKLPLTIIREGKTLEIEVPVSSKKEMLIQQRLGEYPPYFIYGAIVFSSVDSLIMRAMASGNSHQAAMVMATYGHPIITRAGDHPDFPGEELVFIPSPFFPHKLTKGYGNPIGRVVSKVNGIKIKNLKHIVEVLRDLKDDYVIFEFEGRAKESLVFLRKEIVGVTEDILNDNGVRSQGSPELMEIWKAKKS